MTPSIVPINGKPCGQWVSKEKRWCSAPVFYRCPLCSAEKCFEHSPISKPPSKRRCCLWREITEGEVQAWIAGDPEHAIALATRQETVRRLGLIGLGLEVGKARRIVSGDISAAIVAAEAWAKAGARYVELAGFDARAHDEHLSNAGICARNASDCLEHARRWIADRLRGRESNRTKSRRGLTLLSLPVVPDT